MDSRRPDPGPHRRPAGPRRTRRQTRARRALAVAAVLSLLMWGSLAAAQASGTAAPAPGVVVQGSGTADGDPDLATLTLGVEVVEPRVQAALTQADQTMTAVRQVFLDGGVAAKDIRTAVFNLWREDVRDSNGNVTGERYHVVHSYRVTVHALDQVGGLLTAAVQAGANSIQGIQFGLSDPAALQREARTRAMQDAKARAEQLASLAGATLGPPLSIREATQSASPPAPMAALRASGGGGAPVEGGQLSVEVQVTVRYALQ